MVYGFVAAENFFLKNYSGISGIQYLTQPRRLRDLLVRQGIPKELKALSLQDRQWKMALDVAFANIKASHAKTQDEVKASLNRSPLWGDREKHLIRYLLLRPELLFLICIGKVKLAKDELLRETEMPRFNADLKAALNCGDSSLNFQKAATWLRRQYRHRHAKNKKPVIRKWRTYHVDSSMFAFFKENGRSYIAIASKTPRDRIIIPLINGSLSKDDFSGNIKIVLRRDCRAEVHRAIHSIVKKPSFSRTQVLESKEPLKIVAIDKGMTALLHTDQGRKYGEGYSKRFQVWSDDLTQMNAGRARFTALVRNLSEQSDNAKNPKTRTKLLRKVQRIVRNNLGNLKATRKREKIQLENRKEIGTAVNAFFREEQPQVLITENLRFLSFRKLGKRTNRLLSSWSKGTLRDTLEKGAKQNGILLEEVNAAFTSQYCRNCFFVSRKSRRGEVFDCVACQHKENADFAAAKNIRDRFFDSEIGDKTPVNEVKEVLLSRYRVRLSTLGLNESVRRSSSANDLKLK